MSEAIVLLFGEGRASLPRMFPLRREAYLFSLFALIFLFCPLAGRGTSPPLHDSHLPPQGEALSFFPPLPFFGEIFLRFLSCWPAVALSPRSFLRGTLPPPQRFFFFTRGRSPFPSVLAPRTFFFFLLPSFFLLERTPSRRPFLPPEPDRCRPSPEPALTEATPPFLKAPLFLFLFFLHGGPQLPPTLASQGSHPPPSLLPRFRSLSGG